MSRQHLISQIDRTCSKDSRKYARTSDNQTSLYVILQALNYSVEKEQIPNQILSR